MLALAAVVVLIALGVWLFCLLDVMSTDEEDIRYLPKFGWFLVVLFGFDLGAIAWLVFGRPRKVELPEAASPPPGPDAAGEPRGPDDDPDFLKGLDRRFRDDD